MNDIMMFSVAMEGFQNKNRIEYSKIDE